MEQIEDSERHEKSPSPGKAERQKFKRERPGPYPKGARGRALNGPPYNRVLVTNIPYEEKWQALKDLFRQKSKFEAFQHFFLFAFIQFDFSLKLVGLISVYFLCTY